MHYHRIYLDSRMFQIFYRFGYRKHPTLIFATTASNVFITEFILLSKTTFKSICDIFESCLIILQCHNTLICCVLKSVESLLKEPLLNELLKIFCFYRTWNSSPYSKSHLNVLHFLHVISLRYISMLSSYLYLCLPSGILYIPITPMCPACVLRPMSLTWPP
jgi:hypothetical protein